MESSGDMSHQCVCCGGLSSPAVTSLRCARPARDEDVQVILVGFQGDGNERSGHASHSPPQASSWVRGRTGKLGLGGEWILTDLRKLPRSGRVHLRWPSPPGVAQRSGNPGAPGTTSSPSRWCPSPGPSTVKGHGQWWGWIYGRGGSTWAPGLPT